MDIVARSRELAEQVMSGPEGDALDEIENAGTGEHGACSASLAVETFRLLQGINPPRAARFATALRKRAEGT